MKALVLGVGLQGQTLLYDLERSPIVKEVVAVDTSEDSVREFIERMGLRKACPVGADTADEERIRALMDGVDIVVELLPPPYSLGVIRMAVEAGVNLVNTMYPVNPGETDAGRRKAAEEEVAELGVLARSKGLTILPEMGLDPGIDLVLCGEAVRAFDEIEEFYSYGSGFPEPSAAGNPLKYKITWSFDSTLKSYKRPARVSREGQVVGIAAEAVFLRENTHRIELDGLAGSTRMRTETQRNMLGCSASRTP